MIGGGGERGWVLDRVLRGLLLSTGWLAGRSRFEGLEHIPARGGALVVANHLSHLDPVFSGLIVHRARRVPRFLAKHSLWSVPVLGQALRGTGQIPVYRDSADAQRSLREGTRALADGKVVVIYPEGTITRDPDQWPMHSRTGVARLALTSDVPVLPMVHWGTREVSTATRSASAPCRANPSSSAAGRPSTSPPTAGARSTRACCARSPT